MGKAILWAVYVVYAILVVYQYIATYHCKALPPNPVSDAIYAPLLTTPYCLGFDSLNIEHYSNE